MKKIMENWEAELEEKGIGQREINGILKNCMKYEVKITNTSTGDTEKFLYKDSVANYREGKEADIKTAIYCVMSDAKAGINYESIDEFQSEFGYEKASKAKEVLNGCKEALSKLKKLGFSEEQIRKLEKEYRE